MRNITMVVARLIKSGIRVLVVLTSLSIASASYAIDADLIYSGFPPMGEQYYTANIICGDLDGRPGEEIVITDDFGSFQVLSWNKESHEFRERWVSDPIFEHSRIMRVYLPSSADIDKSDILFINDQNDLRIFRWYHYLVNDEGSFNLNENLENAFISDFVCGRFRRISDAWEFVGIAKIPLPFFNSHTVNFLVSGKISEKTVFTNLYLTGIINEHSSLGVVNKGSRKNQETLITTLDESRSSFSALHSSYPFNSGKMYYFQDNLSIRKIGWSGSIEKSEIPFVTYLTRSEAGDSYLNFAPLSVEIDEIWSMPVPSNMSKWTLGDLNGNGIRELIILDFHGMIHIYDLSSHFAALENILASVNYRGGDS